MLASDFSDGSSVETQTYRKGHAHRPMESTPLLVHWAAKGTTKPLRFAPRLTGLFRKTGELGCYVHDDECDHDYRPALTSKRLI